MREYFTCKTCSVFRQPGLIVLLYSTELIVSFWASCLVCLSVCLRLCQSLHLLLLYVCIKSHCCYAILPICLFFTPTFYLSVCFSLPMCPSFCVCIFALLLVFAPVPFFLCLHLFPDEYIDKMFLSVLSNEYCMASLFTCIHYYMCCLFACLPDSIFPSLSFIHSGYLYSAPSRNLLRGALSPAIRSKRNVLRSLQKEDMLF